MSSRLQAEQKEQAKQSGTPRRNFLSGVGAVGIAAVAGAVTTKPAGATPVPQVAVPPRLSSIDHLKVTREESFDVPNGKESFYEWQASDAQGVTTKFVFHHTRTDVGETYTLNTDITVLKFAAGADLSGPPTATSQQKLTAFGVKGEMVGNVRHDEVTMTTVHADGSSSRELRIVPVRLDLSEYAGQDLATILKSVGSRFVGQ